MIKGSKASDETKRKVSLATTGENNPMFGKHHSEATIQKMSESKLGNKNYWFGKHHTEESILKMSLANLGEKSHLWKGGRFNDTRGYIMIHNPSHPYANYSGYVFEHRLAMEKLLGRYLTKKEVVHHINGIYDDNRIENLILFISQREHVKYHAQLKSA